MSKIQQINRRDFVKLFGLASTGIILGCNVSSNKKEFLPQVDGTFTPNLFVQIQKDGNITLIASRSEMGQGIKTSLASAIADELEADWQYITVKQATGNAKYGNQNTDGSRSVRTILEPMRKMGAASKMMLITAAAKKWNVAESVCKAENHYVVNTNSGDKIFFGDLVDEAAKVAIPADENIKLKKVKDFKYIGKDLKSVDLKDFTHGTANYGIDFRIPNLKFAAIARCPVAYGTVKSFDSTDAEKVAGVEKVMKLDKMDPPIGQFFGVLGGVAVIANNTWSAFQGKLELDIEWNYGDNHSFNSDEYKELLTQRVHQKGKLVPGKKGDVFTAFESADKIVEATYHVPFLAHAPMEVPNATAWFQKDKIEVWAPLQDPQTARAELAHFFEIPIENITINVTMLGGGFGRKSKSDFVVEAVTLSKEMNAPVQVVWTREDDIKHGFYHSTSAQYLKGSLDKNGQVSGWLQRLAMPSIASIFKPLSDYATGSELNQGFTNNPYSLTNFRLENAKAEAHLRIGWLRSVINIHSGFGNNSFVDELAYAVNIDSVQFHLDLIGKDRIIQGKSEHPYNSKRMKDVLKKTAKMANWGKTLPKNHGLGVAIQYSFYSYVATIVEVAVIEDKVKVKNTWTTIDCGLVLNKDNVKNQLEGSVFFGMSLALYGKISTKEGSVEQNNFFDYQMTRMKDAPNIHIHIMDKMNEKPTGVGEPGVPVMAPAICNAIFNATGKRIRSLPLVDIGMV
ncbi:twin-arginine translocation pathway signal protein [Polaribacter reichenbachii]|uniref:Twin-arginine translocation pathway signal protein n=1 Tax=Polaribacter reichenbachii TaxID=996801 RepID=A0A1B8U528_9FLAO|nr:molybdopterin cofactor-binding domain-containing protein [Polaribacter reichenbachii]APZ44790.1 twin-arginine translocation pathway signal protein [Polaribacter reichenbachii]AUC18654.1 twin-arginine translocation pathway signal protein [Polaribacter reichenbachii]OBY66949.1 twin-arginine translocation pathway signal protein [Polaribacter reichenbachii]